MKPSVRVMKPGWALSQLDYCRSFLNLSRRRIVPKVPSRVHLTGFYTLSVLYDRFVVRANCGPSLKMKPGLCRPDIYVCIYVCVCVFICQKKARHRDWGSSADVKVLTFLWSVEVLYMYLTQRSQRVYIWILLRGKSTLVTYVAKVLKVGMSHIIIIM